MKHFRYINNFDVSEALKQLKAHPELWNTHTERTVHDTFAGTSDIWLRFRDKKELLEPKHFGEPHDSVFYPAWKLLPAIHSMVHELMYDVKALRLGGILITKIPPHGHIKPHHDRGRWHPEFYKTKVYVPLKANPFCINRCEDERVVMETGEAWYFNNLVEHEVINAGDTERITLIVCMRTEEDERVAC